MAFLLFWIYFWIKELMKALILSFHFSLLLFSGRLVWIDLVDDLFLDQRFFLFFLFSFLFSLDFILQ